MSVFNLELLLRSQDLQLTISPSLQEGSSPLDESLIWEDCSGPLTISRVESKDSNCYRLRLGDEVAVDVEPESRLAVLAGPGTPKATIDHFLADQVFPRVLSHRDGLVLHAGAIRDADRAFLLLGPSGSGKSTLVTSFLQSGWTLMGDDAVVLSVSNDIPSARAVYPSLRLFSDSLDALFSTPVASHDMAHYSNKQRLDVDVERTHSGPARISAIFALGKDGPIGVRPLTAAQACMAIIENSFALDPTDRERARQRLDRASHLARLIPAFSISYPRDYDCLPEVRAAILSAVADGQSLRH